MTDELRNILQEADRANDISPLSEITVEGLSETLARRRRRRAAASALVAAFAVLAVTISITPGRKDTQSEVVPVTTDDTEMIRQQITKLEQQATTHAHIADHLAALQRHRTRMVHYESQTRSPDPIHHVMREAETAALLMVDKAERLPDSSETVRTFQRTIDLFPGTRGAEIARQRLLEIPKTAGEQT